MHVPGQALDLGSSLAGCETTARYHHSERRVGREFVHALVETPEIFGNERLNVGIRDRRRHALEFAYFARDV